VTRMVYQIATPCAHCAKGGARMLRRFFCVEQAPVSLIWKSQQNAKGILFEGLQDCLYAVHLSGFVKAAGCTQLPETDQVDRLRRSCFEVTDIVSVVDVFLDDLYLHFQGLISVSYESEVVLLKSIQCRTGRL
jgi:hypothetical protein